MKQRVYTQVFLVIIIILFNVQFTYSRVVRVHTHENTFNNIFNFTENAENFLAKLSEIIESPGFAATIAAGKVVDVQKFGLPSQHSLDYSWYRITINYLHKEPNGRSEDMNLTFIIHYSDYTKTQHTEVAWRFLSDKRGEFYLKLPNNIANLVANKIKEAASEQYAEEILFRNLVIPWITDATVKKEFLEHIEKDKLSRLILEHCSLFEGALSTPPIFALTDYNVLALWLEMCDSVFRGFNKGYYQFPILFHELGHALYHRLETEQQQAIKNHLIKNHSERNSNQFLIEIIQDFISTDAEVDSLNPYVYPGFHYEQIFSDLLATLIERYRAVLWGRDAVDLEQDLKIADINLFISLGILPEDLAPVNLGFELEQYEKLPDKYFELLYAYLEEMP